MAYPHPAVFTRSNPCTKVHIWNAFFDPEVGRLGRVGVVHAQSFIGLNTPKYLSKKGYVALVTEDSRDYMELTPEGVEWLRKGLAKYLEQHPAEKGNAAGYFIDRALKPKRYKRL